MLKNINASPIVVKSVASGSSYTHKCILCIPETPLKSSKIAWHLKEIHQTSSTMKCIDCSEVGSKEDLLFHYSRAHGKGDKSQKFIKFILAYNEEIPREALPAIHAAKKNSKRLKIIANEQNNKGLVKTCAPKNLVKKTADKTSSIKSSGNQNLMQAIKEKTYMGPSAWTKKPIEESSVSSKKAEDSSLKPISKVSPTVSSTVASSSVASIDPRVTNAKPTYKKCKEFPLVKIRKERDSLPFFCFFCDELKTQEEGKAILHLKEHIGFGFHCNFCDFMDQNLNIVNTHYSKAHVNEPRTFHDDKTSRLGDLNWIHDFLENQFKYSLHDDDDDEEDDWGIQCILCIRAARLERTKAYSYKSLSEFRNHFFDHSRWNRVDCTKCGETVKSSNKKMSHHAEDAHNEKKDEEFFNRRNCAFIDNFIDDEISRKTEEYWESMKAFYKCRECTVRPEKLDFSRLNFNLKNVDATMIKTATKDSQSCVTTSMSDKSKVKTAHDHKVTETSKNILHRKDSQEGKLVKEEPRALLDGKPNDVTKKVKDASKVDNVRTSKEKSGSHESNNVKDRRVSEDVKVKDKTKNDDVKTSKHKSHDVKDREDVKVKDKIRNDVDKDKFVSRSVEIKDRRNSDSSKASQSKHSDDSKKHHSKVEESRNKHEKIEKHEKKSESDKSSLKCVDSNAQLWKNKPVESLKGKRPVTEIGGKDKINESSLEKRAKKDDTKTPVVSAMKPLNNQNKRNTEATHTFIQQVAKRVKSTDISTTESSCANSSSTNKMGVEKNTENVKHKVSNISAISSDTNLVSSVIKPTGKSDCVKEFGTNSITNKMSDTVKKVESKIESTATKDVCVTRQISVSGKSVCDEIKDSGSNLVKTVTNDKLDESSEQANDNIKNNDIQKLREYRKKSTTSSDSVPHIGKNESEIGTVLASSKKLDEPADKSKRERVIPTVDDDAISPATNVADVAAVMDTNKTPHTSNLNKDAAEDSAIPQAEQTSVTVDHTDTLKDITAVSNTKLNTDKESFVEDEKIKSPATSHEESNSNVTINTSNDSSVTDKISVMSTESESKPERKNLDELKSSLQPGWVGCGHCSLALESKNFMKHHKETHPRLSKFKLTPFRNGANKLP